MKHANLILGVVVVISLGVIVVATYFLFQTSDFVPKTATTTSQNTLNIPAAPTVSSKNDLNTTSQYLNSLNIDTAYTGDTEQLNVESNGL